MIAWLIGAVTLILLVLIAGRRSSKAFRRKTEEPKYQFLANVGISPEEIDRLQQEEMQEEGKKRQQ